MPKRYTGPAVVIVLPHFRSTEGTRLFVASADKTLVVFDMETY